MRGKGLSMFIAGVMLVLLVDAIRDGDALFAAVGAFAFTTNLIAGLLQE